MNEGEGSQTLEDREEPPRLVAKVREPCVTASKQGNASYSNGLLNLDPLERREDFKDLRLLLVDSLKLHPILRPARLTKQPVNRVNSW